MVTGLGTVGAYGSGTESLREVLASSEMPAASEVDRSAGYHLVQAPRKALLVDHALLREWVPPGEARRMSPPSRFALATARMALRSAGLGGGPPDERTGVVISNAFGPCSYSEGLLRQILLEGPESASPILFMESVANAPAAQIAIALRARGPSVTICQREAGALLAVGQAAADVAAGRVVRALAGTLDEMTPLLHSLLDRFGALARNGGPEATPHGNQHARPLDRRRAGYLAAEGATMLLLESGESAAGRGASPLARVAAWGSAFDPTAPAVGWGTGYAGLARSLRRSLERAGIPLERIDRIVTGASGSRPGDRVEALLLREAWGEMPLPPVLAPKAVTGEYGGGFLGAAVLAGGGARFGPTAGFEEPDPELGVVPHDGRLLPPPSTVLVTSVAAGGAASWLVLEAP